MKFILNSMFQSRSEYCKYDVDDWRGRLNSLFFRLGCDSQQTSCKREGCGAILAIAIVVLSVSFCFGQGSNVPNATAGDTRKFEVASVRFSKAGTPRRSTEPLDGLDGPSSGSLFIANAPLLSYLLFAYKITDSNQSLSIYDQLPDRWKHRTIAVEARAAGTPSRDEMRLMVKNLLID